MEEVGTVDSPLTKCAGCDSVIDNDGDGGRWSEISGAEFCWGCFESDMEHASTITYFRNGEKPAAVKISSNRVPSPLENPATAIRATACKLLRSVAGDDLQTV